jgi:hypothetical protein
MKKKQREITGKIRRISIHSNSSIMTIFPTLNGLQKRGALVGEGISERVVKDMFTQYRLQDRGCTYRVRVCNGHRLQLHSLAHQYSLQEHELHKCFIKNYFKLSVRNESKLGRIISQLSGFNLKKKTFSNPTMVKINISVTLRHKNTMLLTLIVIFILVIRTANLTLRSQTRGYCSTGISSM